jgi:hypothetical protein
LRVYVLWRRAAPPWLFHSSYPALAGFSF